MSKKFHILDRKLVTRRVFLIAYDALAVAASAFLALFLRANLVFGDIEPKFLTTVKETVLITMALTVAVFWFFRLYHSLWEFASVNEMQNLVVACSVMTVIQYIMIRLLNMPIPRSYPLFYAFLEIAFTFVSRFAYRFFRGLKHKAQNKKNGTNVMIVGAGEAANAIIKEIQGSNFSHMVIKCLIDDDPNKWGRFVQGVKVVGDRNKIIESANFYSIDEIFIAIPTASRATIKELTQICQETGCKLSTLPGYYQLVNGEVSVSKLRSVDVEDLLGREPVRVDIDSILGYVKDKVIMVTGGGGSIGSELCRQIATHSPKQLIIVDIYENNAYDIQQELKIKYPALNLVVLVASVRNTNRMNYIFETYHPEIVYHAAAHKHVPLMEDSPNEAIKNNVLGTWKTADAAARYGVKKFVMISTDKAVNPTNIMGASKRICEMIVQTYNKKSDTEFVAVRFGNVLGSNGSVIPLFKKQILAGGPVTVTHPDIIRYFMTIPEAVSLVLQAGAYAKGGEIFVLDMGEPVKILDLAKNLIRLSGYKVDEDIKIEFTGLRPGEKLYEELLMDEEGLTDTDNKLIHIGKPLKIDEEKFFEQLERLSKAAKNEEPNIRELVKEIVPTYHPLEQSK
jgi:FlaA1/EpsC-like NDP-sugar epimerase